MNRTLLVFSCLATAIFTFPSLVNAQFHDENGKMRTMFNPYSQKPASRSGYTPQSNSKGLHNPSIKKGRVHALVISDKIAEKRQQDARGEGSALRGVPGTREHGQAVMNALNNKEAGSADFPINMDEFKPEHFRNITIAKTVMEYGDSDVWGRCQNHSDGTYTETIFDNDKRNPDQMKQSGSDGLTVVIQRTRRPSIEQSRDPILLERKIYLDQFGVPKKVDIFDGNNNLKFKGFFIYDRFQRLAEEQIFQPTNSSSPSTSFSDSHSREGLTLIRRKEYPYHETSGAPLPPRTWDYCRCGRSQNKRASANGCKHCMQSNGQELVALIQTRHDPQIFQDKIDRLRKDVDDGYQGIKLRKNKRLGQSIKAAPQAKPFFANKAAKSTAQPTQEAEPLQKKRRFQLFRKGS